MSTGNTKIPPFRSSRPTRPDPGTPDEARMATKRLPGPAPRKATIKVTDKNPRPRPLVAKDGAPLGDPGHTGSPNRGPNLTPGGHDPFAGQGAIFSQ